MSIIEMKISSAEFEINQHYWQLSTMPTPYTDNNYNYYLRHSRLPSGSDRE